MHSVNSEPTTAPELDVSPDLPLVANKDKEASLSSEKALQVLRFLKSYSPEEEQRDPADRSAFDKTVRDAVDSGKPFHMVLPAFPFKSPNNIDKTLGTLPDLGEEVALARLENITADLERNFSIRASLSIVSDGLVYNDLLGVPEEKVWNYSTRLRELAEAKFPHIKFARLHDLVGMEPAKDVEEYKVAAKVQREKLVAENLAKDFDVKMHLKSNVSALMTYRGYCKFLLTDLAQSHKDLSKKKAKKENETIAKKMIARGTAFSNAVEKTFPSAIRLSIHASKNPKKLPIAMFPGDNAFVTPWHAACGHNLDGSFTIAHREALAENPNYELVHKDGRPSHFQEQSELLNCADIKVDITPIYPSGISIAPKDSSEKPLITEVDMKKVETLAELNAPVVLKGFSFPKEASKFVDADKTGDILLAKNGGFESDGIIDILNDDVKPTLDIEGLLRTDLISRSDEKVVKEENVFSFDSDTDVEEDVEWREATLGMRRGYLAF